MRKRVIIITSITLIAVIAGMYLVVYVGVSKSVRLPRQEIFKTPADYGSL